MRVADALARLIICTDSQGLALLIDVIRTKDHVLTIMIITVLDWPQSLKHFTINASFHILVASLILMALF